MMVAGSTGDVTELAISDPLEYDTVYRWRVRARYDGAFGQWSATADFRTPTPPRGGGRITGSVGANRHISPEEALDLIINYHDSIRADLGSRSSREQRVEFWCSAVAVIHFGHPRFNPAGGDPGWCVKDAGGGRPPSDDVLVRCDTRDAWDLIGRRRERLLVPSPTTSAAWRAAERLSAAAERPALTVARVDFRGRGAVRQGRDYDRGVLRMQPIVTQEYPRPVADTFYRSFSEKELTDYGAQRRGKIEQSRLALLTPYAKPPGDMLEIGPGHGTLAQQAVAAGYRYRCIEASPILADYLRKKGFEVTEAFTPPIPGDDAQRGRGLRRSGAGTHVRHRRRARLRGRSKRILRPGGVFFVVVPDYLKERTFFWDVDYTHNFVTTERRVKQLLYDGGFTVEKVVRSIGVSTGVARDVLAAGALLVNLPGVDALSRYTEDREPAVQGPQEPVRDADVRRAHAAARELHRL